MSKVSKNIVRTILNLPRFSEKIIEVPSRFFQIFNLCWQPGLEVRNRVVGPKYFLDFQKLSGTNCLFFLTVCKSNKYQRFPRSSKSITVLLFLGAQRPCAFIFTISRARRSKVSGPCWGVVLWNFWIGGHLGNLCPIYQNLVPKWSLKNKQKKTCPWGVGVGIILDRVGIPWTELETLGIELGSSWIELRTPWIELATPWIELGTPWIELETPWIELGTLWIDQDRSHDRCKMMKMQTPPPFSNELDDFERRNMWVLLAMQAVSWGGPELKTGGVRPVGLYYWEYSPRSKHLHGQPISPFKII